MKKRTVVLTILLMLLLCGAAGAYVAIGSHYQTHFFEHTSINGIDVSDLTVAEAEQLIADQAEDYHVTVTTREGTQETIDGSQIGYRFVSQGEVQGYLEQQNFLLWLPAYLGEADSYTMEASVTWDSDLLEDAIASLNCMQEDQVTQPQDAYLTREEDGTFVIVPEVEGNLLDADKVAALLRDTIDQGLEEASLEEAECYVTPSIYSGNGALKSEMAIRNRYSSITITYDMSGGVTETLDSDTIYSWFSLSESNEISIDYDAVAAWVNQLADQYDTIGASLPFTTSNGETVYPQSITYGWQMDRDAETEALYQAVVQGDSTERSPVWLEGAWTRGENDIGDTYVEIDYTNQRMWYYKDGALLVETPVVTGNVSAGNASPEGVFCLVGKEENATLVGEDYQTPVSYWMPFYGGVGIHDADSWRSTYGGEIYLTSGSHGCINTPTSQAAIIYRNIEIGTPIVCYSSGTSYGYDQWSTGTEPTVTDSSQADIVIIREDEAEIPATAGDETEAPITIGDETEASATAGDDAEFPITVEDEIIIY